MASSSFSFSPIKLEAVQNEQVPEILPCILDGKFFIYSEADSTTTKKVAFCTFCQPKEVKICGFNNSTSNFVTHLKRRHGEDVFKEYQIYSKNMKKSKQYSRMPKRHRQTETGDNNDETGEQTISQEQFNDSIMKFFIHSMIPLQAIDDPYFKKIFESFIMTAIGLNVVSRITLGNMIDDWYIYEMTSVNSELRDVKEVCTTADVWLEKTQFFLGVTSHWLDSNLKRKSKTLACRRFPGTPSYDRIAPLLEAVHAEFGLDSRNVLATINDNSSNFVQAFKEFGVDMEGSEYYTNNIDVNVEYEIHPIIKIEADAEINSISHFNINQVNPSAVVGHDISELPVHIRCCAYKLTLCASTDAVKVLRNNGTIIADIHNQVIKKCNSIWKCTDCPELAEIIQSILGHNLTKPESTRWNTLFDALKQIALTQEKSIQLHMALGMTNTLCDNDFQYINEYLHCSKPIADALDILQGDQDMYYGILLPCLVSLRKKLQKLNRESLTFCQNLAKIYLESVEARFADFFDFSSKVAQNAAIAAMSYPRFKDKWIACVGIEDRSRINSIFKEAVVKEIYEASETIEVAPNNSYEDSYFEFDTDSGGQRCKEDVIISHYLADQDRDVSMLNRYPEIKRVFQKYNTPLPSSGAIERMFSFGTMTNLPNSQTLSDEMFEKRMVLKSNYLSCS